MAWGKGRMQRRVTREVEQAAYESLGARMKALPPMVTVLEGRNNDREVARPDERLGAWLSVGQGRTAPQFLRTWPAGRLKIEDRECSSAAARYYGIAVPGCVVWSDVGATVGGVTGTANERMLDRSGAAVLQLKGAGGNHTALHDETYFAVCGALERVGAEVEREPEKVIAVAIQRTRQAGAAASQLAQAFCRPDFSVRYPGRCGGEQLDHTLL
jgi:hypothetical protein